MGRDLLARLGFAGVLVLILIEILAVKAAHSTGRTGKVLIIHQPVTGRVMQATEIAGAAISLLKTGEDVAGKSFGGIIRLTATGKQQPVTASNIYFPVSGNLSWNDREKLCLSNCKSNISLPLLLPTGYFTVPCKKYNLFYRSSCEKAGSHISLSL